ncbi:MASE1 domain-containing sensor histidine kinase [Xenorhabdus griffiniae]|uniref:MASE1 domain-containing protein n=1 Tax=Xenorhabdus griffiniae TaxID=351672 RepID=A0ABY9XJW7_9GAMM|nr:MASE1 domain-containing protein [Xenorhabdus griffiniae]MBD1228942.1 MASE1 domain-containing protein [Xenorhabdus griffiniae]MBE8589211.1 MASE1 domain-containing protein [Xenorhabdus griffiniae]WMV73191.1 MASE1 domain-containing protein [Xenorhabdus griffiniae]WNH02870.1 MASE1 domain-containing protein [Xenorhabdus griffiniae]
MNEKFLFILQSLFLCLFYSLIWISLWVISFYFHNSGLQSTLFLPQGIRLVFMTLLGRRYLPILLMSEISILLWLKSEQLIIYPIILLSPFISLIPALIIQKIWWNYSLYWQQLSILLAGVIINSLLQILFLSFSLPDQISFIFLSSLTGGFLLSPFIYLIYVYLYEKYWKNQHTKADIADPQLRTSLLMWCFLFSLLGISGQYLLSSEIEWLLSILVFIPNIFMAYHYGWQGGVLSALLGSLLVTSARQFNGSFSELQELEIFLTTQALLGIGLGIAISRQQQLAGSLTYQKQLANNLNRYRERLEKELATRHILMQKLVHTEEDIRKNIARELHDAIGQNITAIQIQSMLIKRTSTLTLAQKSAEQINHLSQQIHQTTRQLLRELRPPALDEMSLEQSIHHLINEFAFEEQNICCHFDYQLPHTPSDNTITLTLYRLIQELLNNISKHANADQINITLKQKRNLIVLQVDDNGIGIIDDKKNTGFGLKGIEERVRALGGHWRLKIQQGTHVNIYLPVDSGSNTE